MNNNIHLLAESLYVTLGEAKALDHNGKPFVLEDYPVGTILAKDSNGDWFKYCGFDDVVEPDCWPDKENGNIPLFRDHWNYITYNEMSTAPYALAIFNAPMRKFK